MTYLCYSFPLRSSSYLGQCHGGRVGDAEQPGEVEGHDLALHELGPTLPVPGARVAAAGGELHEAVLVAAAVDL